MLPFMPARFGSLAAYAPAGGGSPSVAVDVVGTELYHASSGSTNFNYTGLTITAALTNPALICTIFRADGSNDVEAGIAVTWNGVSMTLLKKQDASFPQQSAFIFGLRNPASGNKTLNVSATNTAADNFVNCVSFSNVNQASDGAAFPNVAGQVTGSGTGATLSVTSASGHIVVGVFEANSGPTLLGSTIFYDNVNGSLQNVYADYVVSSGTTTTVGTTAPASVTAIAGCDISN
jgi:hypothetical protein